MNIDGASEYHHLLAIPSPEKLRSVLKYLLDEKEFLSPYGVRALSRYHKDHPFEVNVEGVVHRVEYVPAESNTYMFGGNSNWRGPIWLCGRLTLYHLTQDLGYRFMTRPLWILASRLLKFMFTEGSTARFNET